MNRRQALFLSAVASAALLTITGGLAGAPGGGGGEGRVLVVATFYPLAYMAEGIGGERVAVETLIPHNTEVHSWQPSISKIAAAQEAVVILYNGAGLDLWVGEDILPTLNLEGKQVVDTTQGLELIEASGGEQGQGPYDPHTWISPYMALGQAEKIYEALVEADKEGEGYYGERWEALRVRLEELDAAYKEGLGGGGTIFVSHAAYGYLAQRYGFNQVGVIGISAEEQPSTYTVSRMVDDMEEQGSNVICLDPVYSEEYAQTLREELERRSGRRVDVLELYLMLGPTDGLDYLAQMEENLKNLKLGLSKDG